MNSEQMNEAEWFYRGRTPQKTQFEMVENPPKKDFQKVRLMGFKSSLEKKQKIAGDVFVVDFANS